MKFSKLAIVTIATLSLVCSCAKDKDKDKDVTAEVAYTKAMKALKEHDYSGAATDFSKINDDYPLSHWGIQSQIMAAYSYYKEDKYEDVIKTVDDFVHNNPANSDVAYMQYLKSLSYYNHISEIDRSQDNAQLASYAFRELIARFPNTIYSEDARKRLANVDDHIAGAKMSVGRYQISTTNYNGAIKNFQEVINRYSRTEQTAEAYFRLVEIHYKLGLKEEAKSYVKQLEDSYPDNKWTKLAKSTVND